MASNDEAEKRRLAGKIQRMDSIIKLHDSGQSFKSCGSCFCLSASRAEQIYKQGKRILRAYQSLESWMDWRMKVKASFVQGGLPGLGKRR